MTTLFCSGGRSRWFRAGTCVGAVCFGFLILTGAQAAAGPIVVTDVAALETIGSPSAAAAMVASLVGGNPGIIIVPGSELYVGAPRAAGLFSGGAEILPFLSGVALTTGSANLAPFPTDLENPDGCPNVGIAGPNDCTSASYNNLVAGDADLGNDTLDASALSFRFVPAGDSISFQYVFGSEEYNEFVGSDFNDVFAFFLNGVNIALINGTPVAINSVNDDPANPNRGYFTDNSGRTLDIQYDGLVGIGIPLSATSSVVPGTEYSIKLAIADVGDGTYDSGVMLAAGTFSTNVPPGPPPSQPPIPEPATFVLAGTGIAALLRRACTRRGAHETPQ